MTFEFGPGLLAEKRVEVTDEDGQAGTVEVGQVMTATAARTEEVGG